MLDFEKQLLHGKMRLKTLSEYEYPEQYFEFLKGIGLDYVIQYMLIVLLTEHIYVEHKQVLIEYLQLPDNLNDKELIAYIQLLGD